MSRWRSRFRLPCLPSADILVAGAGSQRPRVTLRTQQVLKGLVFPPHKSRRELCLPWCQPGALGLTRVLGGCCPCSCRPIAGMGASQGLLGCSTQRAGALRMQEQLPGGAAGHFRGEAPAWAQSHGPFLPKCWRTFQIFSVIVRMCGLGREITSTHRDVSRAAPTCQLVL